MEIEEFIKSTLRQIINGVNAIDDEGISNHDTILDRSTGIEFDLAVTAETSDETNKGAGLKIHIAQGGIDKSSLTKESSTSRIKFKVYP